MANFINVHLCSNMAHILPSLIAVYTHKSSMWSTLMISLKSYLFKFMYSAYLDGSCIFNRFLIFVLFCLLIRKVYQTPLLGLQNSVFLFRLLSIFALYTLKLHYKNVYKFTMTTLATCRSFRHHNMPLLMFVNAFFFIVSLKSIKIINC